MHNLNLKCKLFAFQCTYFVAFWARSGSGICGRPGTGPAMRHGNQTTSITTWFYCIGWLHPHRTAGRNGAGTPQPRAVACSFLTKPGSSPAALTDSITSADFAGSGRRRRGRMPAGSTVAGRRRGLSSRRCWSGLHAMDSLFGIRLITIFCRSADRKAICMQRIALTVGDVIFPAVGQLWACSWRAVRFSTHFDEGCARFF